MRRLKLLILGDLLVGRVCFHGALLKTGKRNEQGGVDVVFVEAAVLGDLRTTGEDERSRVATGKWQMTTLPFWDMPVLELISGP